MPVVSKAQNRFMQAASHDPAFAKRAGIKQSVATEFVAATGSTKGLPERVKRHPPLKRRIVRG